MSIGSMMRQVLAHPLDFYYDLQEPKRAKWSHGVIVIALVFIVRMATLLLTSYHYQTSEAYEISYLHEFIWIVIPWLTWTIANWGVSTILDGEGKFKEIFVGTAYALVPFIIFAIPVTLLTNVLALSESGIYSGLMGLVFGWAGLLVLIKLKVLHDFEAGKVVFITLLTLLAVMIIWFVGILLYGLLSQFVSFFWDIIREMRFRI